MQPQPVPPPKGARCADDAKDLMPSLSVPMAFAGAALFLASGASAHESFHERIDAATRGIEADPGKAELLLDRSVLYREHGDFAEALADLERAAQLAPTPADLDYFRGRLQLEWGHPDRAEEPLRRVLAAQPDHPAAQVALARTLVALGRPLEAAAHYARAIEHEPVPIPEHHLARARALIAAGRSEEALRALDEGMQKLGPIVSLALPALQIEAAAGRTDAALARLDRIARTSPRQETWLARRAEILERAGRREPAREAWAQVLREIDSLPRHHRATPAVLALASRARESLDRLAQPEPEP